MSFGELNLHPYAMSRFWLRRLLEMAFLSCFVIILLYVWARFIPTGYALPVGLKITDGAAAAAGLHNLVIVCLYLWLPRTHLARIGIGAYLATVAVFMITIHSSGGLESPFITLWIIAGLLAGFFGGIVLGLMVGLVFMQLLFLIAVNSDSMVIIGSFITGVLPLIFSFIFWNLHRPELREPATYTKLVEKLSAAKSTSDVVVNTIDDGVLAITKDGVIELINPSAQRMLGWNQHDALELKWQSVLRIVTEDNREVDMRNNPIAQSLETNRPAHSNKFFLLTSSNKRLMASIVSSPIGNNNEGIIVVFRDITKERAEEREQAEFISTASHEMRTPVASIEGYLGLALNPATAHIDDKARDFITKAHASAQHLGRLFQDLLDISKAEDGRLQDSPRVLNVTDFVRVSFDGLRPKAKEKGLQYVFWPDADKNNIEGEHALQPILYAYVDPDHLREVLDNLIENAIKYTAAGTVIVDVIGDDSMISISIKDSGIGIPAEDIPHLFQKFYRVDNSETREINGTGLGLYLSRRLVEHMSGNLRVESEYKQGSTFYLEIPRLSHSDAQQKLEEASHDVTIQEIHTPSMNNPATPAAPPPIHSSTALTPEEPELPPLADIPTSSTISQPAQPDNSTSTSDTRPNHTPESSTAGKDAAFDTGSLTLEQVEQRLIAQETQDAATRTTTET